MTAAPASRRSRGAERRLVSKLSIIGRDAHTTRPDRHQRLLTHLAISARPLWGPTLIALRGGEDT